MRIECVFGVRIFAVWCSLLVAGIVQAENVTIEVGYLSAPAEAENWFRKEIASFEEAHPGIQVKLIAPVEPNHEFFPLHKNPPLPRNIIGIDSYLGYEIPYLAERRVLVPIDTFTPDPGFDRSGFYENQWESVTYEEKVWGVPWAAWSDVLVCDWSLFEKAGITEPPKTWEEFADIAKSLTRDLDGDGKIDQWGLRLNVREDTLVHIILTMILQRGGSISKDGQFDLSHPACREAFQFIHDLHQVDKVVELDERSIDVIQRESPGRFGMYLISSHRVADIARYSNLRLAHIPGAESTETSFNVRRLYLSIMKSTPAEEQASWSFIKWMSRKDISLPEAYRGFPARSDLLQRTDFRKLIESNVQAPFIVLEAQRYGRDIPGNRVVNFLSGAQTLMRPMLGTLRDISRYDRALVRALADANAAIQPIETERKRAF